MPLLKIRCFLYCLFLLLGCLFRVSPVFALTPAGTMILGQAKAVYIDVKSGSTVTVLSNQSTVKVGPVFAPVLEQNQSSTVSPGQTFYFIHTLENRGNTPDSYDLKVAAYEGICTDDNACPVTDQVEIQGVYVYQGALPNKDEAPIEHSGVLAPGEKLTLVVMAQSSSLVAANERFSLRLTAQSTGNEQLSISNTDRITVSEQSILLHKSSRHIANNKEKGRGSLEYTLSLINSGSLPIVSREITIIGHQPVKGLLLEDPVPANTQLFSRAPEYAPIQAIPVIKAGHQWYTFDQWKIKQLKPTAIGLVIPENHLMPGHKSQMSFDVSINPSVGKNGLIKNTAGIDLNNNGDLDVVSNQTVDKVGGASTEPGETSELTFVEPEDRQKAPAFDDSFTESRHFFLPDQLIGGAALQEDVYFKLRSPPFNQSSAIAETVDIQVSSGKTGGKVTLRLLETAANSGLFKSIAPLRLDRNKQSTGICTTANDQPDYSHVPENCYLKSRPGDTLEARVVEPDSNKMLQDQASIGSDGLVFNSDTMNPVKGAVVRFFDIDDNPAQPAGNDQRVPQVEEQTTQADGRFLFPRMKEGSYYIDVAAPAGFIFPSATPADDYASVRVTRSSYGKQGVPRDDEQEHPVQPFSLTPLGAFDYSPGTLVDAFDIPVDVAVSGNDGENLTLTKEALQKQVAPGELVGYKLTLKNPSDNTLYNLKVHDQLPFGFKYVAGSVRVNGRKMADPEGAPGSTLTFVLNANNDNLEFPAGDNWEITYALQAGAGAIDSDGINTATAEGKLLAGDTVRSAVAQAHVTVAMEGVLSDKAILFGKVYVDGNCDNIQNNGEWPIGGVRLYMEDGTWAITDENGQYSLMGLNPGNHIIKVDPITLPDGLVLKPLDNRNAADGNSRFADMVAGEMHRADFAAICPASEDYPRIFKTIKERNKSISGNWMLEEAAQYSLSKPSEEADSMGDLSSGIISQRVMTDDSSDGNDQLDYLNSQSLAITSEKILSTPMPDPQQVVKTITRAQGKKGKWLWPLDSHNDGRFMAVVRSGVQPTLYVNGEAIDDSRLGEQLLNNREKSQLLAWYGVPLEDGENQVEIKATDMFGNERVMLTGQFMQASEAVSIEVITDRETLAADEGRSLMPVKIRLLDKMGQPARGTYYVTVDAKGLRWQEPDAQEGEPGYQLRVENGEATVHLRSGNTVGRIKIRATVGDLQGEKELTQVAAPRPLIAAGIVELNGRRGSVRGSVPNLEDITDGNSSDGRAAVFLKGEVAKDTQLTLSYDSDKDDDAELFRDVDPNDYYPITGDASEKGYEAQSRSKLYAKIEKDRSSIMWGDYQTDSDASEADLAKIQRKLTGVNGIYDNGQTRIQGFAARPEDNHKTEIIKPDGTAMNYRLQGAPIVSNSEVLVLEVRDKNNPGLMIRSETLSRGTDYTLDEISGYLKFSKPMHSQDERGNPQQIRASYDVEGNGDAYTVAGARVEHKLNEQIVAGASATHDGHKTDGSDVQGAWLEVKPSEKTTVTLSAAQMTSKEQAKESDVIRELKGNAWRARVKHQWDVDSETEATWAKADKEYTNSAGGITAGREETSIEHKQSLNNTTDLRAKAEVSRSLDDNETANGEGNSVGAYIDKKVGHGWKLTAGSRYIQQQNKDDQAQYMTGLAGAEKRFKLLGKEASIKGEYEHGLNNARWRALAEADWKVYDQVSLYSRYEWDEHLSPTAAGTDQNQFAFGVKSEWENNARTYSEYRMRGATDGRNLEWVNGADTRIEIVKGLSISPSIENINTISGDDSNDGLALSLGVDDKRHKNQRAIGQIEYRNGKTQDFYGLDAAIARRLSLDWSGLVREEYRLEKPKNNESTKTRKHAMSVGLARRPKLENRQHGLYLYQWKDERGQNPADDRIVHLVSTHQNRQINSFMTLSGRVGSKWVQTSWNGDRYNTQTWLADSRLIWDLNRRWDLDLRGGFLAVDGDDSLRWSMGIGINYLVARNLRIGAYYNFIGFRDEDLDSEKYNAEGIHLTMQFKFDESLFDWFNS